MNISPINNFSNKDKSISCKSQFAPTNALKRTLVKAEQKPRKNLLKAMRKLMNDGLDRTITIDGYRDPNCKYYIGTILKCGNETKIRNTKGLSSNQSANSKMEYDTRMLIEDFAGKLDDPEVVKMTNEQVANEIKLIRKQIFSKK